MQYVTNQFTNTLVDALTVQRKKGIYMYIRTAEASTSDILHVTSSKCGSFGTKIVQGCYQMQLLEELVQ